jgi:hypothetical protein
MAVFCEPRDPVPALDRAAEAVPAEAPPTVTDAPPAPADQPPTAPETPEPV